jgi:hypothetical protein
MRGDKQAAAGVGGRRLARMLTSSSFAATRDVVVLTAFGALLYAIGRRHGQKI